MQIHTIFELFCDALVSNGLSVCLVFGLSSTNKIKFAHDVLMAQSGHVVSRHKFQLSRNAACNGVSSFRTGIGL